MSTTAERLAEAEDAYHRLATGTSVVEVRDSNGETVRYQMANRGSLLTYIEQLKAEIAKINGQPISVAGPANVWF
jgi:hypothetical protein